MSEKTAAAPADWSETMQQPPRWKHRPEGSNWGDFGPDDELGRINLITPAKVLEGIAEVKAGRSFCLSLPLDYPGTSAISPRRKPPVLSPTIREGRPNMNFPMRMDDPKATDVICDDSVLLHTQYSTQWDSLAHVGQMFDADGDGHPEDLFYNGFRANLDIVGPVIYSDDGGQLPTSGHLGARHLGLEKMAASCVQGRAVMIDVEHHFGRTGKLIGYNELLHILDADGVVVETGDMVCIRTGYAQMVLDMNKRPDAEVLRRTNSALDGGDARLHQWITDSGLSALICDNYAVEALPATVDHDCSHHSNVPLHAHCLFKLGIPFGELWYLSELGDWLRAHGRSRFLLTAPP
ncbi:MAG: cyclase family protein, partial [Desulfobacterales bacterium]|nr:cyclase family protein [Desulfobacterales bacterium]